MVPGGFMMFQVVPRFSKYETLKHLNVCWLSLELAVDRSLKQYASFKSFFLSEEAPTTSGNSDFGGLKRIKRLKKAFEDTMTEVYLYF